jgi:hypothetical protein
MITLITIAAFAGFVAFVVVVARLGRDVEFDAADLFDRPGVIGRALGVQESDLPPFQFGGQAG